MRKPFPVRKELSKLSRFDAVEVVWIDSFSSEAFWFSIDSFDFDEHTVVSASMRSVGFYIHHDDYNIFITHSINEQTEAVYGLYSIPIDAILSLKVLSH